MSVMRFYIPHHPASMAESGANTRRQDILMMVTRTIKVSMWALAILGLVMVSLPLRKVSDWIEH